MALNWLPRQANPIDTLFKGFPDNLIQNMMERKKLAQQEAQHKEEMELRRQSAARAGANSDLQRMLLQQQLLSAQHANDPMYGYNTMMAIQKKMDEDAMGQGGQASQPGGQQEYPELEKMFKGQGMFNLPEQNQEEGNVPGMPGQMPGSEAPPAQPTQPTQPHHGGLNLDLMRKNPAFHAMAKSVLKYDPLAQVPQTPEEKEAMAIDLYKKKEAIKAANGGTLPAAIKTLHENIIQLSPKAHKAIQHLIDIPSPFEPWGFGAIQSGQKAEHNKAVKAAAENYAKAKGWPNTKGSIQEVKDILERGKYETDSDYHKRLKGYQDELDEGVELSNQFLHPEKALSKTNNNAKSDPLGLGL